MEDHEPSRETLKKMLVMRGHAVTTADSAGEALAAAEAAIFDCIISDLGLPDEDGYSLMKKLQTTHPTLAGIALSGYGMEEDLRRSDEAGFRAHLVKPVTFQTLESALAAVMR